jgi:hypothetical protein
MSTKELIEDAKAADLITDYHGYLMVRPVPKDFDEFITRLAKLVELQRQRERQAVPDGWKLVPVEPTQAMCQAGQNKASEWPKFPLRINPIYQAMLSAAPSPELISPHPIVPDDVIKDAERYRWLRQSGVNWIRVDVDTEIGMSDPNNYDFPSTLDASIDSFMPDCPHPIVEETRALAYLKAWLQDVHDIEVKTQFEHALIDDLYDRIQALQATKG